MESDQLKAVLEQLIENEPELMEKFAKFMCAKGLFGHFRVNRGGQTFSVEVLVTSKRKNLTILDIDEEYEIL